MVQNLSHFFLSIFCLISALNREFLLTICSSVYHSSCPVLYNYVDKRVFSKLFLWIGDVTHTLMSWKFASLRWPWNFWSDRFIQCDAPRHPDGCGKWDYWGSHGMALTLLWVPSIQVTYQRLLPPWCQVDNGTQAHHGWWTVRQGRSPGIDWLLSDIKIIHKG